MNYAERAIAEMDKADDFGVPGNDEWEYRLQRAAVWAMLETAHRLKVLADVHADAHDLTRPKE